MAGSFQAQHLERSEQLEGEAQNDCAGETTTKYQGEKIKENLAGQRGS